MDSGFKKGSDGNWSAPLPFRPDRPRAPNNYEYAINRAKSLQINLRKHPAKCQQFVEFMGKMLQNGHAEVAPKLANGQECWYLPVFGVYHPRKPEQLRCVFDSSARFKDLSLNSVLLQGPDMTNSLLGILLRFRREKVAIVADIQRMFYSFRVHEEHRDFLRFLWHAENDPDKPLVEYRMWVHVFGNSPSPAISTYSLRKSVDNLDLDVQNFVEQDFYVDDALASLPTSSEAVDLMKRTQGALSESNIVLHKIASNQEEAILAFPVDQFAKGLKDLDLQNETLPTQRSLGLQWDMNKDTFFFTTTPSSKPFTRRGLLSVINSLFDPIGFLAPVTIQGKLILRNLMNGSIDWDAPLPPTKLQKWTVWKNVLLQLGQVEIPRCYAPVSWSQTTRVELHTFCDASEFAIAAVSYLVSHSADGQRHVSFAMGKAKVAPTSGHTIPRLELCATVLAVQVSKTVRDSLRIELQNMQYYSDRIIVLGYIHNTSRRFLTYVSNRVEKIRNVSRPDQWKYISTQLNPADIGTRGVQADKLQDSPWLTGPPFLLHQEENLEECDGTDTEDSV